MKSFRGIGNGTTLRLALVTLLAAGMAAGCNSSGSDKMNGGNGNQASGSGGGSQQGGANARGSQKGGGGQSSGGGNPSGQLSEPAYTTNGSPNGPTATASDDGSATAVSHQSVAEPGAPESSDKNNRQPSKKPQ